MTRIITPSNATTRAATVADNYDRAHDAAIDHGAVVGAHVHLAAIAGAQHLKRGAASTAGYSTGFCRGFASGWRTAAK